MSIVRTMLCPAVSLAVVRATRTGLAQKRKRPAKGSRRAEDRPGRPISGATKRKYLAAVQSFATYLVKVGVLTSNPVRDVQAPPPSKPRVVEIPLADVLRIVENAPSPYPALFALLYGAGVEVSAALACVESDVDIQRREVRARGTKNHNRDRIVRVAQWAWPFVEKHLETPDARRTAVPWDRSLAGWRRASRAPNGAQSPASPRPRLAPLLRDPRDQSRNPVVAKVYGRFAPRSDERDR